MEVKDGEEIILDVLDEDLIFQGKGTVKAQDGQKIVIKGTIEAENDIYLECSVTAEDLESNEGDVSIKGFLNVPGSINVQDGNLYVQDKLECEDLDVTGKFQLDGDLKCETLRVGGATNVKGNIEAEDIEIGGPFTCEGEVKADEVEVGGKLEFKGHLICESLEIGWRGEILSGEVRDVEVGGKFTVNDSLQCRELDVRGRVKIKKDLTVTKDCEVGGKLTVDGNLNFQDLEVGAGAIVNGNMSGRSVEVGGSLEANKDLIVLKDMEIGGKLHVNGTCKCRDLEVRGKLYAGILEVEDIDAGGTIECDKGLFSTGIVKLKDNAKIIGPIVGKEVRISSGSKVKDVWAQKIDLENYSSAENLYGDYIRIGAYCRVYGNVLFTKKVIFEEDNEVDANPKKVDELPPAPKPETLI